VTTQQAISAPVREGDVLAGKYRVERLLGEGAMGVVVAAMHVHLGERVALKFLRPELAANTEVVARFLREAQSAVRIKGEHIARVSDVGTLDGGAPYMVMEYLTGSDLGALLEQRGPLDVALAVDCVIQACDALAEAHALGIVHRDLKPSNLFLTTRADGSALVKVLDFGVAKLLKSDPMSPPLTAMGAVIGSPVYMSPEQLLGKKTVDARSDVWQLGVILYELVSGVCPFDGKTMADIMVAIGVHPAKPLRQVRPDVPEGIEQVVARCLEKDPAKRMPDVAALAEGLLPFATTRRAQVSVEHIVTLLKGVAAAANLPPMRDRLQSGAMLLERMSSASAIPLAGNEHSNAFAQTLMSPPDTARNPGPAAVAAPVPVAPPQPARVAPPADASVARPGALVKTGSSVTPWIAVGLVVVLAGLVLAALGLAHSHDAPRPASIAAPAPGR
jgi:serine/threonine protein kinase